MGGTIQTSAIKHESASTANITLASDGKTTFGGLIDTGATGQIKFPATANPSADANTLDDYEEGTWTPVMGDGTNNYTLSKAKGWYTKVGAMVAIDCNIAWSSIGSAGAAALYISGLPFTPFNGDADYRFGGSLSLVDGIDTQGLQITVLGYTNLTKVSLYRLVDNSGGTDVMANAQSSSGIMRISATYRSN